jgi:hypothetical protein
MEITTKLYTRTNDNGTHYARIIVPKALRAFVARPVLWRSLSTKVDAEAVVTGAVVAVGTRNVFQELSNAYAESAVVVLEAEIVSTTLDLDALLKNINQDELRLVTESLKKSLGITVGVDVDGAGSGGNTGGNAKSAEKRTSKKKSKTDTAGEKNWENENDASVPLLTAQVGPGALEDEDVARYIELRPHGIFRFRYWVPRSLQKAFGQREVRGTLGTVDRSEAVEKAKPLLLEVRHQLLLIQEKKNATSVTWSNYRHKLTKHSSTRAGLRA